MLFNVYLTTRSLMMADVESLWSPLLSEEDVGRQRSMWTLSKILTCLLCRYLFLSFQQNPKMSYTLNVRQTLNGWVTARFQGEERYLSQVMFPLLHLMKLPVLNQDKDTAI